MKLFWFVCFAMLSITMSLAAFDATATDWPNEIPLSKLTCNAQTLIDFSFGSTMSASKLNFLDKDGV